MRGRAVATFAEDGDANRVGVSVTVPGAGPNFARRELVAGVQRHGYIGLGETCEQAVVDHFLAPVIVSSAGWPISISVPRQVFFVFAMIVAVPMSDAMCRSWPQACMTGTSRPASSLVWILLA